MSGSPSGVMQISLGAWYVMSSHARATCPEECCGALLGWKCPGWKLGREALPLVNAAPGGREHGYRLEPAEICEADRRARKRGLEVVGIYHSHPQGGASFSETDRENAWPWLSFVVLSMAGGRIETAASWTLGEDRRLVREALLAPEAGS